METVGEDKGPGFIGHVDEPRVGFVAGICGILRGGRCGRREVVRVRRHAGLRGRR